MKGELHGESLQIEWVEPESYEQVWHVLQVKGIHEIMLEVPEWIQTVAQFTPVGDVLKKKTPEQCLSRCSGVFIVSLNIRLNHIFRTDEAVEVFRRQQSRFYGCFFQRNVFRKCEFGDFRGVFIADMRIQCRYQHKRLI